MNNPYETTVRDIDTRLSIQKITSLPVLNELDRELPIVQKVHLLERLREFFLPLSIHEPLLLRIHNLIKNGYATRNPLLPKYKHKLTQKNIFDSPEEPHQKLWLSLIGPYGIGKRQSVERILRSNYPQVVSHRLDCLAIDQILWLKITYPLDGSVATLASQILLEIDRILGTSYRRIYLSRNIEDFTCSVVKLMFIHATGILVVEDIHFMLDDPGPEPIRTTILDFLQKISSSAGIPVMVIGESEVESLLPDTMPIINWVPLPFGDDWENFVSNIAKYQWTAEEVRGQEFSPTLYELSEGCLDIAVRLYIGAQQRALRLGLPCLNRETIKYAFRELRL